MSRESDPFQQFRRPRRARATLHALQDERPRDVLRCGQHRNEVKGLEHESELFVSDRGERAIVAPAEVQAVDTDGAGVGMVETADEVEQRALAAAGRTDRGHELAGVDFEIDPAQHLQSGVGRRVRLRHRPQGDDAHGVRCAVLQLLVDPDHFPGHPGRRRELVEPVERQHVVERRIAPAEHLRQAGVHVGPDHAHREVPGSRVQRPVQMAQAAIGVAGLVDDTRSVTRHQRVGASEVRPGLDIVGESLQVALEPRHRLLRRTLLALDRTVVQGDGLLAQRRVLRRQIDTRFGGCRG